MLETIRVLLIGVEESFFKLAKRYLTKNSENVIIDFISSPFEALQCLESQVYDVIVSDYQMPGLTGLEILKKLRQAGNSTLFIIITEKGQEKVAVQALNLGADYYLQKNALSNSLFIQLTNIVFKEAEKKREWEKAEKILRETKERYQTLVEKLREAVVVEDENQIISFVNPRVIEMFGYTEEELVGQHWKIIVTPESIPKILRETANRPYNISNTYEATLLAKNGTRIPAIISATPLFDDTGNFRGVLSVFTDITEQKQREAQFKQQREELKLFLDIISHDLKNHFTMSQGYLDIALLEITNPDLATMLKKSRAATLRAVSLVNDISVLMKHQLSYSYELHPINVAQTIDRVTTFLQEVFPLRTIEFSVTNLSPGLSILADSLFEDLLMNLLSNAVKNDEHEVVHVEIGIEAVLDQPNFIILAITDHGKGIPPDQRKGIFDRFTEFRKKGKGSGLGLFIVKTLVDRYKGQIWIESRVPDDYTQGTRFKIQLQSE
ncbi:MAG: PAS domain S-box protein [Candidatus Hermodarchaeota archaeon]